MTWPSVPLGTVAEVQLGKMLSPKARTGVSSFPYLRNVNVQWGRLDLSDLIEMDFDNDEREKFALKKGDLLVCEGGEPGRSAVVERDLSEVFFQKALMRVRPRNHQLDTRFLQRFMELAARRGTFAKDGNQATIAHFPAVKLNALQVPLPPLLEQRRIADILDKADAIRRKRQQAIALTDELLRSAFLEMFGDPVTNPKGWDAKQLGQLCDEFGGEVQTGPFGSQLHASDYVLDGIPSVMPKDIVGERISAESIARVRESDAQRLHIHRLRDGDIIYARRGDIGRRALITEREDGWLCGTGCLRIRLAPDAVRPEYLVAYLGQPGIRRWVEERAQGSTMLNLNTTILRGVPILVPPHELQGKWAALRARHRSLSDIGNRWIRDADVLFASLVQRAFRGELSGAASESQSGSLEVGAR